MRSFLLAAALTGWAAASARSQAVDTTAFGSLSWRSLGPQRGGRSVAVAGSASRPQEYYMGTTGGGVFKSADGGASWQPVSDRYFGGTLGAIAVAESNPDIVYVGGGEYPIRGNTSHGDGVYKTTNGGQTWQYLGLVETRHIAKIRIHPRNPDLVYVAALGPVFGQSPHRGVYKSTDGGRTWSNVLKRAGNDSTGAIELVMDPSDPNVLYAGLWEAYRRPWLMNSGGAGSGIFKTTDGGTTWKEITRNPGLPQGVIGNIGITVSPANPKRVWAIVEADSGGVFRSDDAGETWTLVNAERKLRQRAWYYTRIFADPKDENAVYVLNVQFWRSTDGGKTFPRPIQTHHGDYHDLWLAPNDPMRMVVGDDGGAEVSFNGGRSWTDVDYPTAQFYHVTTTNHFPYRVCGAQQDNSTACVSSRPDFGSHFAEYYDAGGGESGYIAVRPDNPDVIYAGSYGGHLTRKDTRSGFERNINPWPLNPMGHSAVDAKYRMQWTFPIVISPHDPNTLYVGSSVVFRSTNEGESFTAISPDMTRNDPRTLGPSGGPITRDQTSVEYYGTVYTIAESPVERGVIWAGSDDGLVQVTRNGGQSWENVTPAELRAPGPKEWARISIIEASPHGRGVAYVAAKRFQLNDFAPYLYKTSDYGKTWTKIVSGINPGEFTHVVREDPARQGLLVAGTERGVWVSLDDGGSWQRLQRNLPPVPIHDLQIKEGDIVVGTHGRGFWIMEDISSLRQLKADVIAKDVHLFQPRDAYRTFGGGAIQYWLKRGGQKVTLEFLDAKGQLIRRFTSEPDSIAAADSVSAARVDRARLDSLLALGVLPEAARAAAAAPPSFEAGWRYLPPPRVPNRAGANSFTWNLRYPDAVGFKGMIFWAAGLNGPTAPPGTYTVRLTAGEKTETQTFKLLKDPRSQGSESDLAEQFAFALQIRDRTSEANTAVLTIRNVKAQIKDRLAKAAGRSPQLERLANALRDNLSAVEAEIYQVKNQSGQDPLNYPIKLNNQIAALAGVVQSAETKPTAQSYEVFRVLSAELEVQLGKMRALLDGGLTGVNAELGRLGLERIVPSAEEVAP